MGGSEYLFLTIFFGLPGIAGVVLARRRDKNPFVWGIAAAVFPFCVLILWFQRPDHTVPGAFRKCAACGYVYPWKYQVCRSCEAPATVEQGHPVS